MIRKNIPNFITSLNVVSGTLAVLFAIKGNLTISVILILAAAIFDFFDGMSARLLKSYSPLGKELDSLADMVSFGLAPGMLMMVMLEYSLFGSNVRIITLSGLSFGEIAIVASALLIPVFSALRLAKFNIDTRQTNSFIGLPTPANALFISSLALITEHGHFSRLDTFLLNPITLVIITIGMSLLLVSELPMFSLKFKNLSWRDNQIRFIFISLSVILVLLLGIYGITASIATFIMLSLFQKIKG